MKRGFTLIELITSLAIFTIIMTISMGSVISILEANRKSRAFKTSLSTLNALVEGMSKEMRYGHTYHCGTGDLATPLDCPSGSNRVGFRSNDGRYVVYTTTSPISSLSGFIWKGSSSAFSSGNSVVPVTSPDLFVDNLTFYVIGSEPAGDMEQPKIFIVLKSHIGQGEARTDFTIQTLVSQRSLDI